jgi:hypothetical protein
MNGGRVTGKGAVIALALGALAFTGVSAVLSAPRRSNASPGSVEDQAYPLHAAECAFNGWALDDSTSIAAQTFTAGISGALTDVVMALAGTNQNIKVSITGVDATGAPTVATPLTSTSLNPAPYPVRPATDVTISFSSPARVTAGQQYAIVLTSVPSCEGGPPLLPAKDGLPPLDEPANCPARQADCPSRTEDDGCLRREAG